MKHKDMAAMMGKVVECSEEYVRTDVDDYQTGWERRKIEPRAGWITGFRWLQTGRVVRGWDEPNEWLEAKVPRKLAVLVVFWPNANTVRVPLDSISETDMEPDNRLSQLWTEADRADMRRQAKDFPRDRRGRFVKDKTLRLIDGVWFRKRADGVLVKAGPS